MVALFPSRPADIFRDELVHSYIVGKTLKNQPESNLHNARAKIACYFSVANVVGSIARRSRSRQIAARQVDAAPLGVVERIEGLPPEL